MERCESQDTRFVLLVLHADEHAVYAGLNILPCLLLPPTLELVTDEV
jgi:hypothetical protein